LVLKPAAPLLAIVVIVCAAAGAADSENRGDVWTHAGALLLLS